MMNDGRALKVQHPDFVLLPPDWTSTAIVAYPKEKFEFVYIRNISTIASEGEIPSLPTKRRGRNGEEPEG